MVEYHYIYLMLICLSSYATTLPRGQEHLSSLTAKGSSWPLQASQRLNPKNLIGELQSLAYLWLGLSRIHQYEVFGMMHSLSMTCLWIWEALGLKKPWLMSRPNMSFPPLGSLRPLKQLPAKSHLLWPRSPSRRNPGTRCTSGTLDQYNIYIYISFI